MMMAKKHASKPPLTQSKIRLWTKKVLKHVKPGEKTACETDASTSSNSKPTIKTTGWKLRSPLSRRSPAKENPVQAAEIEKLKQAIKVIESQSSEPHEDESETLESLRAENRCLEEYKAAAARLAQEKLESQPRMTQRRCFPIPFFFHQIYFGSYETLIYFLKHLLLNTQKF